MKYASKAPPRGSAPTTGAKFDAGGSPRPPKSSVSLTTDRPKGGGGNGAGFGLASGRAGPIGPTGGKTSAQTSPRLLDDRLLVARDNSGGIVGSNNYVRHTLFRDPSQGGVGSPMNDLAYATARRDGQPRDTQFQEPARQREQTIAQPGPTLQGKVGTDLPKSKISGKPINQAN